jgi:hypothetical protein
MKVASNDSALATAGIDETESKEVDKALQSQDIKAEIDKAFADGKLTDEEKDEVGSMVADKASAALQAQGKDGLSTEEKMAVAEFCDKCLNDLAKEAEVEVVESESAT